MKIRELLAVALGGALGTLGRVSIDIGFQNYPQGAAFATLIVNVLGAFALGWALSHGLAQLTPWLRQGITVGFLGSFTTFSALALLSATEPLAFAVGALLVNFSLGVLAAWAGIRRGRAPLASKGNTL
ncbi:MAG: CrcB protein [Pontimonas sp.]